MKNTGQQIQMSSCPKKSTDECALNRLDQETKSGMDSMEQENLGNQIQIFAK